MSHDSGNTNAVPCNMCKGLWPACGCNPPIPSKDQYEQFTQALQHGARPQIVISPPPRANYLQHLGWVENEIQEARRSLGAEDRLVKLAEECVRQAEQQRTAAGKRVSALEAEAARTRAAIAGIDQ